jgi:hypothetical protein
VTSGNYRQAAGVAQCLVVGVLDARVLQTEIPRTFRVAPGRPPGVGTP